MGGEGGGGDGPGMTSTTQLGEAGKETVRPSAVARYSLSSVITPNSIGTLVEQGPSRRTLTMLSVEATTICPLLTKSRYSPIQLKT